MEKNDVFTAVMDGYTSEGQGVCRHEGRAVFVSGALEGEEWRVRVVKVSAHAVYGRGEELLRPSPHRVQPDCPAFPRCGGCALRHMDYGEELRFKLRRVNDALRRIGGTDFAVEEILPARGDALQRCKAIFNVGCTAGGQLAAGFYRPRSHEIASDSQCPLVRPEARRAAGAVLAWMEKSGLEPHDEISGREGVRHVFVRSSHLTGRCVVTLIVSCGLSPTLRRSLTDALRLACPEMSGLVLCTNRQRGNTVLAGEYCTLWGAAELEESLCSLRFSLSPRSFFQVNPPQAERLYEKAVGYAIGGGEELVLDLYCGTGTIGLCMAGRAGRVIGVEVIPEAVENARENARRNGIENAEFLCADAAEAAQALRGRSLRPDAVVVDPPRKGLTPQLIGCIADMAPRRVVYVSCDPGTLGRDVALFRDHGYLPRQGCAVDMFPRTHHVETVVLMSKVGVEYA